MKLVINYFDKTAIISSVQEGVDFINSLQYRGNSHSLQCSHFCEQKLMEIFSGKFYNGQELTTTGISTTRIRIYTALADTLEDHNALVKIQKDQELYVKQQKNEERNQLHLAEMYEANKGWYVVTITGTAFKLTGSDSQVTRSVKVLANNKMEAYNGAIQNLEQNPPKNVMNWYGFESSKSALIEFIGVWTDEAELEYGS